MTTASKWDNWHVLAFDTETTGIDTLNDRIITASIVELQPGHRPAVTTWITDPGIDIPEAAAAVHGYTRDRLIAEATHTPEQMLFEITATLAPWLGAGRPVVTYNGSFDLTFLEAENHRHDVDPLTSRLGRIAPIVDVHVLDKYADPYRKGGRKLVDVCTHYGVRHTGAHDAAGDALATARLWPLVMRKHARKFPGQTITGLHEAQVKWRREQMHSLRGYFDRQGIEHDGCDPGWPLLDRLSTVPAAAGGVR